MSQSSFECKSKGEYHKPNYFSFKYHTTDWIRKLIADFWFRNLNNVLSSTGTNWIAVFNKSSLSMRESIQLRGFHFLTNLLNCKRLTLLWSWVLQWTRTTFTYSIYCCIQPRLRWWEHCVIWLLKNLQPLFEEHLGTIQLVDLIWWFPVLIYP